MPLFSIILYLSLQRGKYTFGKLVRPTVCSHYFLQNCGNWCLSSYFLLTGHYRRKLQSEAFFKREFKCIILDILQETYGAVTRPLRWATVKCYQPRMQCTFVMAAPANLKASKSSYSFPIYRKQYLFCHFIQRISDLALNCRYFKGMLLKHAGFPLTSRGKYLRTFPWKLATTLPRKPTSSLVTHLVHRYPKTPTLNFPWKLSTL